MTPALTARSDVSRDEAGTLARNLVGRVTMQERVKIFTFVSGHGETVVEPPHEEHINQWLESMHGRLVCISQSESERAGAGHHITLCVWYVPEYPR
jgi:hypothetical protein